MGKMCGNACIGPVTIWAGPDKADVAAVFAQFEGDIRAQFIGSGDRVRGHEGVVFGVQDQGRNADGFQELS